MRKIAAILASALLSAGCSLEYKAEVVSDTEWSGSFEHRTVDGSGNREVSLGSEHPACCVVQKETEHGYLKVRIVADGRWIFTPGDTDWVQTNAHYGVVSCCSDG